MYIENIEVKLGKNKKKRFFSRYIIYIYILARYMLNTTKYV